MTKEDRRRYLILKDPNIYKGIFLLSLPIMFNNFIRTIHDLVDMYFVSNIPGYTSDAVGAISITFPVIFVFISLGMGLSVAGTALISQLVGGNQREEASKYATNLVFLSIVVGIVLNLLGYIGAPYIMELMGATGYLLEKSSMYLRIRAFELVPMFIFFAFTSIRQSDGDTVLPVVYGVIVVILNIILSPILISVLELGVEGAAYATLISNIVITPFVLYTLLFTKSGIRINFTKYPVTQAVIRPLSKMALPASSGQAITAVGFMIMNSIIISYGVQVVSAFSVGNRISSMVLHPVMAMGGILAAFIGQNVGNANPERARESFRKTMYLSIGIMALLSSILMFFREPLAGIFLDDDPVALELAVRYLFFLLIGLPLMGIFQTFMGAFNGTGHTGYSFVMGITRLWVLRIPLIFAFKNFTDLGPGGIWTAMLISNFVIAFVGFFMYTKIDYKPRVELDI